MAKFKSCYICGEPFFTKGNGRYCSDECREYAEELRRQRINFEDRQKRKQALKCTVDVTIEDMVAETLRLSKELGRAVQYGELQQMVLQGHKIKKG